MRHLGAVEVDLLSVEGLRFKTQRSAEAALNLWEALQIPDDDVNVSFLMNHAQWHGGMSETGHGESRPNHDHRQQPEGTASSKHSSWTSWHHSSNHNLPLKALPAVATAATRKAFRTNSVLSVSRATAPSPVTSSSASASGTGAKRWSEYPIGHPRRRPQWGVPLRFDVRALVATEIQIWILDMFMMDDHGTVESDDNSMTIQTLSVDRERFELNDERRSGTGPDGDGIHGVYLGELVWTLIAVAWPKLIDDAPTALLRTAALACAYDIEDSIEASMVAALQSVRNCGTRLDSLIALHWGGAKQREPGPCVHVHLMMGRGFTQSIGKARGLKVNVSVAIELQHDPLGAAILLVPGKAPSKAAAPSASPSSIAGDCFAEAPMLSYTKTPRWDAHFELGPARSQSSLLRLRCYHHQSPVCASYKTADFMGEVVLPLSSLLIQDQAIGDDGNLVGWFELSDGMGLTSASVRYTGALKLGLRIDGAGDMPP